MPTPEQIKKVAFVIGVLVGGYTVYRLFRNTSKPISFKKTVKETVNDVIDIPVKVVEEAKKVADDSPRKKKRGQKKKSEFSKEKKEHPELPNSTIKKIVADHKRKKSHKKGSSLLDAKPTEKEIAAELRYMRKNSKKVIYPEDHKAAQLMRKYAHKGHSTKRGLSQDQKLKSQEKHERAYRKRKVK